MLFKLACLGYLEVVFEQFIVYGYLYFEGKMFKGQFLGIDKDFIFCLEFLFIDSCQGLEKSLVFFLNILVKVSNEDS